jgi:DNA-binding transcriptional regulator YdaS (Cro superfamily)
MTPADLRAICVSFNDERETGGQSKLARLLGWHHSTVWRKLNARSRISQSDELAIKQAVVSLPKDGLVRQGLTNDLE